jgi:hypothetical protein
MFYVDFGIRGILYIFLCKDLIVIMILHLVHFGIFCFRPIEMWDSVYYLPEHNVPVFFFPDV